MNTHATIRRKDDIESALARGLAPITDNVEALIELAFTPSFTSRRSGREDAVRERSIDDGTRSTPSGLRRVMVRQCAIVRGVAFQLSSTLRAGTANAANAAVRMFPETNAKRHSAFVLLIT